jgi:hypothetical protein
MSGESGELAAALARVRNYFDTLAVALERCDRLRAPRIVREQARASLMFIALFGLTSNVELRRDVELVLDAHADTLRDLIAAATESEVTPRFLVDGDAETTEPSQKDECP